MFKNIMLQWIIYRLETQNKEAMVSYMKKDGKICYEFVLFRVKNNISDDKVLTASKKAHDGFISKCNGYIERKLLKSDDNNWLDLVTWKDEQSAKKAAQEAINDPSCADYFGIIDPETIIMGHYLIKDEY